MASQRKNNNLPRLNPVAFPGGGPQQQQLPTPQQQHHHQQQQQQLGEMTPQTGLDMNFTPLLPSQLLMGSPFQTGSPTTFQSPQFANFNFTQAGQQAGQSAMNNPLSPTGRLMSPIEGVQGGFFGNGFQQPGGRSFSVTEMLQSPTTPFGQNSFSLNSPVGVGMPNQMQGNNTSRTVYLGNIPPDTSAEEILGHVRSGQIESVRLLSDKNCAFISFLDGSSATHFHSDAILKKLNIKGSDIKIGWGKPSQVPSSVALAVQQSGASRNVYLGNLPEDISEEELREELGKFGPIDTIKLVREKNIGFVHYLSIGNAIKAVSQLPQEPKWQAPRRVYYGKDRCAYVSKTQQQNAAQYLGIPAGYANVLNGADRELISNALAQQSVAAAAVATSAGGVSNLGNRTVYLGNIHPETTLEEICNVVRGGLLHHIRYIPDKHICFVTFIDPTAAASFYALSNLQGLMIHNRRLKIGWGKHSGALPPAIAMAVSGGASRNVYVGNLDESWAEERLRQDFSDYGEIELVNTLREKSCAFVNFTNIANAIKAIEGMRGKDEYKRFKINFGKDRCGNPPRQNSGGPQGQAADQQRQTMSQSPPGNDSDSPVRPSSISPGPQSGGQPQSATVLSPGSNPLTMYLNQIQNQPQQADSGINGESAGRAYSMATLPTLQEQEALNNIAANSANSELLHGSLAETPSQPSNAATSVAPNSSGVNSTVGGHLASSKESKASHSRTVSLPVFTHDPFSNNHSNERQNGAVGSGLPPPSHRREQSSFTGLGSGWGGFGNVGYGLGLGSNDGGRTLNGLVEETSR